MPDRHSQLTGARIAAETPSFPAGLHNAYLFSTFNAFSYQVVLNSPMVLYAKTLLGLQFLMGLLAALMQMANTRLAMAVIPVIGRNHFFAIYSVVGNVTLGIAPIAWGLLIDALGARSPVWLGLAWNHYTVFFCRRWIRVCTDPLLVRGLEEPQAASMEELLREVLIQKPMRFWFRLWPRGGA